ncbi:MAG: hypothetical protein [Olavius algarvensis Delta 4 endosymbiont]|nr:MAG: hypothetical protein [Olavius algarvensis Delta 4 endosymbiont]
MTSRVLPAHYKSTNVRNKEHGTCRCPQFFTQMGRVAPGLTGRLVQKAFFAPTKPRVDARGRQYLANGRPFQFQVHGKTIHGWQWGRGPGILFVHGWNSRGIHFGHFFRNLLDNGYRIVTYDAPAHGKSQGRQTNFFEIVDAVKAFFNQAAAPDINGIVAHSLGAGAVINHLAECETDIEAVLLAPAMQPGKLLREAFGRHGIPRPVSEKLIADLERQYGYSLQRQSPHLLVRRVTSRVLIIHDRDDRTTPYADVRHVSEQSNQMVLHSTSGLGHKRLLYNPEIVELVQAYIMERCLAGDDSRQVV